MRNKLGFWIPALLLPVSLLAQPDKKAIVPSSTRFNGYTNYWHDEYKNVYRYGSLFKMAQYDIEKTIAQTKLNIAEDIGLPGLDMQEGFLEALFRRPWQIIREENKDEQRIPGHQVLYVLRPSSAMAKANPYPSTWRQKLGPHQLKAKDFADLKAYKSQTPKGEVLLIVSDDPSAVQKLLDFLTKAKGLLDTYRLHKGWFGAETLLKSVTCTQGHPLDVIARGMNEGVSFFTFNGYMDFLMQDELDQWVKESGMPIVADVGFAPIWGLKDYEHLQVQDMPDRKSWVDYAHKKGGYVFRQVWDPEADTLGLSFDGYVATEGNKEQVDTDNIPFVVTTGPMDGDLINSMLLFADKSVPFTKAEMWKSIMARRTVAVLDQAKMMGSLPYRATAALLYLDRVYLENYFKDRIDIQSELKGYTLEVTVSNFSTQPLNGKLQVRSSTGISSSADQSPLSVQLAAGQQKTYAISLLPSAKAMDHANPLNIQLQYGQQVKQTIAIMDLPKPISVHRLLYGHAPAVEYPLSIHNFTRQSSFPIRIDVKNTEGATVYTTTEKGMAATGTYMQTQVSLPLKAGAYTVTVSALGTSYTSQLGVGGNEGKVTLREEDQNKDGVNEYVIENDKVRVTLLTTGARVIEYFVKERNDNVLFKLWPEKAEDDRRTFRKRGYYPYGGFEDFLGQGSMETHKQYTATVVKREGDQVQVRMVADYFGNELVKTFTLYGNSPLLEVRFALNFINPEANVIGPQPILELGKVHGPEDLFVAPTIYGMEQYRMRMHEYWGRVIKLKEGWSAGYDTQEDVSYVGAYPVDQPLFLHMWMNHPRNSEAHYYYTEFQPWTPIIQKTTMYFTYYLWGDAGGWEKAVRALRERNLITTIK